MKRRLRHPKPHEVTGTHREAAHESHQWQSWACSAETSTESFPSAIGWNTGAPPKQQQNPGDRRNDHRMGKSNALVNNCNGSFRLSPGRGHRHRAARYWPPSDHSCQQSFIGRLTVPRPFMCGKRLVGPLISVGFIRKYSKAQGGWTFVLLGASSELQSLLVKPVRVCI